MPTLFVIEKSPLNPLQFVPETAHVPSRYHTAHQGQALEYNTLLPGQDKADYAYPAELTDDIQLQFSYTFSGLLSIALELLRPIKTTAGLKWDSIAAFTPVSTTLLMNNRVRVDGLNILENTAHFLVSLASINNLTEGYYRFRVTAVYSNLNNGIYDRSYSEISEPVEIRRYHPRTILLQARNYTNDYSTVFVQTSALFSKRVPGALWGQTLDSEDVDYTAQDGSVRKLYARPGEVLNLTIGGGKGVAKWVKSTVNYYLSCDYKAVDGLEISKDTNAKWEMVVPSSHSYPLGGMTMSVRCADPTDRYKSIARPYIVLFTAPATPYFVSKAILTRGTTQYPLGTGYYVSDATSETAMLQSLNRRAMGLGLLGVVEKVGSEVRYYNGPNEAMGGVSVKVLPKYRTYTQDGSAAMAIVLLTATYAGVVFDGGKSTKAIGNGTSVTDLASYTFKAGSGTRDVLVFHDDSIISMDVQGTGIIANAGAMPIGLQNFSIHDTSITTFDFTLFTPVSATLASIDLHNNNITSVSGTGKLGDGTTVPPFNALFVINLGSNKLPVSEVDKVLVDVDLMVANETGYTGGVLNVQLQTPSAAPTSTGTTAATDLTTNYSWTVYTD